MPCVADMPESAPNGVLLSITDGTAMTGEGEKAPRAHQQKIAPIFDQSEDFLAMIHTEIPPEKISRISGAQAAVDKEWQKLFDEVTFDLSSVKPREKVKTEYKDRNEPVHFGPYILFSHLLWA